MDTDSVEGFKAPYLSFQTYWNFLADLTAKPLPPKLDRSIMSNKSGTDQAAIMSALESFGFVDEHWVVQPDLNTFKAADEEARKEILRTQIEVFYEPVLQVSAQNGTPQDLKTVFSERYNLSGDTGRKASTFFLHAAREAGITLSENFPKTRAGSGSPGAPKTAKKATPRKRIPLKNPSPGGTPASKGQTHTIKLASGGTVTLSLSVDLFEVGDEDMSFVLELIQKLRAYKNAHPDSAEPEAAQDEGGVEAT